MIGLERLIDDDSTGPIHNVLDGITRIANAVNALTEMLSCCFCEHIAIDEHPRRDKDANRDETPGCLHYDHPSVPESRSTMCASWSSSANSISILFLPRTVFTLTFVSSARRI